MQGVKLALKLRLELAHTSASLKSRARHIREISFNIDEIDVVKLRSTTNTTVSIFLLFVLLLLTAGS